MLTFIQALEKIQTKTKKKVDILIQSLRRW